jgi:hypothetical protein
VALARTDVSEKLLCSVRRLLVTASVVPRLPILVTLMKEALSFSETSVLTPATRRNILEDAILDIPSVFKVEVSMVIGISCAETPSQESVSLHAHTVQSPESRIIIDSAAQWGAPWGTPCAVHFTGHNRTNSVALSLRTYYTD